MIHLAAFNSDSQSGKVMVSTPKPFPYIIDRSIKYPSYVVATYVHWVSRI
jgi:hypothetical protein